MQALNKIGSSIASGVESTVNTVKENKWKTIATVAALALAGVAAGFAIVGTGGLIIPVALGAAALITGIAVGVTALIEKFSAKKDPLANLPEDPFDRLLAIAHIAHEQVLGTKYDGEFNQDQQLANARLEKEVSEMRLPEQTEYVMPDRNKVKGMNSMLANARLEELEGESFFSIRQRKEIIVS